MQMRSLPKLMQKEMTRKEFLVYAGILLLTITGISGIWKNVSGIVNGTSQKGFGSGPYGL